jgi:hypothetical protein
MDLEVAIILSRICALREKKGHAFMDCLFMPFHIIIGIVKHV